MRELARVMIGNEVYTDLGDVVGKFDEAAATLTVRGHMQQTYNLPQLLAVLQANGAELKVMNADDQATYSHRPVLSGVKFGDAIAACVIGKAV